MTKLTCCACAQTQGNLNISDSDTDNLTWILKLKFIVPEIDWMNNWMICSECCRSLNQAHSFRLMCIISNQNQNLQSICDEVNIPENLISSNEVDIQMLTDMNTIKIERDWVILPNIVEHELDMKVDINQINTEQLIKNESKDNIGIINSSMSHLDVKVLCDDEYKDKKQDINEVILQTNRNQTDLNFDNSDGFYIFNLDTMQNQFFCQLCSLGCDTIQKHYTHIIDDHSEILIRQCLLNNCKVQLEKSKVEYNSYICAYCCKGFNIKYNLKIHLECHLNKQEYECKMCLKRFNTKKSLSRHKINVHLRAHLNKREYECKICLKRYNTNHNLKAHQYYTHMNIKECKHLCKYCDKKYKTKSDLKMHMKGHLNNKEYECKVCSKCYNTRQGLVQHMNVHKDKSEWKYVCTHCGKRFRWATNLNRHVQSHVGGKDFKCHLCSKGFLNKDGLQKHIQTHLPNQQSYKCTHCNNDYKARQSLKNHLIKHHGFDKNELSIHI